MSNNKESVNSEVKQSDRKGKSVIGVLTSGGDAPGMNACVRAVVRAALKDGHEVYGIEYGYSGLFREDSVRPLNSRSVSNIIGLGGTILRTSRCKEFFSKEGRIQAAKRLREIGIEQLVVIGGDGSFTGAKFLFEEHEFPVIGLPGTIDNDIYGTDFTIGYDTAMNTAIEAIDKIRDTADSHERIFLVEVMGRDSGYIAIPTAIGGGAEAAIIPEEARSFTSIVQKIKEGLSRHKKGGSSIVVVAEGADLQSEQVLIDALGDEDKDKIRYVRLGHIQRGGSPTAADRLLASRLGAAAVNALNQGLSNVMVGIVNDQIVYTSLVDAITKNKPISPTLIDLVSLLN